MRLSSSARGAGSVGQTAGPGSSVASPVTLSEGSLLVLAGVRLLVGLLWFQQLFWKLPPSFSGLHPYVMRESQYTFLPGYGSFIQHVFLPNFLLLGAFTWTAELVVALTLLFGVFSRFGALQLYVGTSWTTDAPFRETEEAIGACREMGILAVEMEAAALYALASIRQKAIICFAHVTNSMGQTEGDFEKGQAQGSATILEVLSQTARAWQISSSS